MLEQKVFLSPIKAAETAIQSIGLGYDINLDLRLKCCKRDSSDLSLIDLDGDQGQDIVLPGGIPISNVPKSITCDKGERMRFRSDILTFQQMSEQFNQELSLSSKIPSGLFNNMFDFSGCWQKDAANTRNLAFDGWFITLYTAALSKSQIVLRDHVKQAVPTSWDAAALASFIDRFGTHIIVGVKMGGKDVIYMRQNHSSNLQPAEFQKRLKEMADKRFLDPNGQYSVDPEETHGKDKDIKGIYKRTGGIDNNNNILHYEWLETVQLHPDVISMSFIPITSLLNGVPGSGFLSHAINLYLRYKPPSEQLYQFLEFQLPRQWAPVFSELPLAPQRKQRTSAYLQFSFMGTKLFVNTNPVDVGMRPVTGIRLYLEGKRSNRLAIHLQHLSSLPKFFQLCDDPNGKNCPRLSHDRKYYEPVQWKSFSHICTAPVESDEDLSIVTSAQLQVGNFGLKKILFLRLRFASVLGATLVKKSEWDGPHAPGPKSGFISMLMSGQFTTVQKPPPRPSDVNINSAVYPGRPPVPVRDPKLLKFVDPTEMARGPQDTPGYWVVSGARLLVEQGKISLRVKYSLLTVMLSDDEA